MRVSRDMADRILSEHGWLSQCPSEFQRQVLNNSVLEKFEPGETVYRRGDPLGGIYGLVAGTLSVNTAPPESAARLVHIGALGAWTGEGCFLTRQPRRLELRAIVETWMMHLPLSAMDQIAEENPLAFRYFALILMASAEVMIRVVHDLQKPEADRRIASVLQRMTWSGEQPVPLSQADLGIMANASRKQVNAAFQRFTAAGWLKHSYRSVIILDVEELRRFAEEDL